MSSFWSFFLAEPCISLREFGPASGTHEKVILGITFDFGKSRQ